MIALIIYVSNPLQVRGNMLLCWSNDSMTELIMTSSSESNIHFDGVKWSSYWIFFSLLIEKYVLLDMTLAGTADWFALTM